MDNQELIEALEKAASAYDNLLDSDHPPSILSSIAGLSYSLHAPLFAKAAAALIAQHGEKNDG